MNTDNLKITAMANSLFKLLELEAATPDKTSDADSLEIHPI
ncbi:hypothetical protein [Methylomonas albis]|nr:hypothetical protein [Methylomonas albis]